MLRMTLSFALRTLTSDISVTQERHFAMGDAVPVMQVAAVLMAKSAVELAYKAVSAGQDDVAAALAEQGQAAIWLCLPRG
jgi:hypothetical protein